MSARLSQLLIVSLLPIFYSTSDCAETGYDVELEFHPYLLVQLEELFALQAKHGIITQSYGTLSPLVRHPTGGPLKPVLTKIAKKLSQESGKDVDEGVVLILWNRDKGIIPITTSAKEDNIKKAALALDFPKLSKEDFDEIESVGRKIHWRAQVCACLCCSAGSLGYE